MSYVECAVLGLLHEGYRYGYELDKVIEERSMRYWNNLSRKSIYLALKRMTSKGWIAAREYKSGNMPVQTKYTLTEAGQAKLEEMIAEGLSSQEFVKFGYSVPMAFIYILPAEQAIEQLMKRRTWLIDFIKQIPSQDMDENREEPLGKRANIRLLRAHYHMELEWMDWVISELEKEREEEVDDN
ncbi:PadR family transcriptional regulator [Salibacterium aidingense]|uniref:PadR family transcriptional regulator n=1 Tax=Salibacterium aidingense TaxID=384933 RepID=UPI00047A7FFA|nr:PadR family transcriptional regulator [Salibacterium aidingense]